MCVSLCKTGTCWVEPNPRKSQARCPYMGFGSGLKLSPTQQLGLDPLSTVWQIPRDRTCPSPPWRSETALDNQGHGVISSYSKRWKNLWWISGRGTELLFSKPCMGCNVALALQRQGSSPPVLGPARFTFLFLCISQKLFAKNLFDHV